MTLKPPTRIHPGGSRSLRPQDGRRANLSLVLQSIYDDPTLTRADLSRKTGLTKVTISDLVAALIADDLVCETGMTSDVRPGKPATTLAVRDDSKDVVAVDLSASDVLRGGVFTIRGQKKSEASISLDERVSTEAVNAVLDLISTIIAQTTCPILGIGVGSPGIVDASGTVIAAPNLDWQNLDLQEIIASRLGLPTVVQNDANVAVMAEQAFASASPDLLRVQISGGVGAGISIADTLVLGPHAGAGEIGHMSVDPKGLPCSCGKRGCLETFISVPRLREHLSNGESLIPAGKLLGTALAPIVAALDLQEIIVGGPEDLLGDEFIAACRDLIVECTHSQFRGDFSMKPSSLGNEAVLLGAVSLVLRTTLGVS